MSNYTLKAETREVKGKKVEQLRDKGLIPAILYGHGLKNFNLSVNKNDFIKIYNQIGESTLVNLQLNEAKPVKILIHDIQRNPLNDEIIHADFYQIREDEKIKTHIKFEFIGEAPAVKEFGGIIVKNLDEIEIECLPKDLESIGKVIIDLSLLKKIDDSLHVKDLSLPKQVKVLAEPDEVIVLAALPQEEKVEEVKAVTEVEVVGEKKEEVVEGEVKEEKAVLEPKKENEKK
jgi:large subunit ribosomal protein L25